MTDGMVCMEKPGLFEQLWWEHCGFVQKRHPTIWGSVSTAVGRERFSPALECGAGFKRGFSAFGA